MFLARILMILFLISIPLLSFGVVEEISEADIEILPARYWDTIFWIWLVLSVIIFIIVVTISVIFIVKYRYRDGNEKPEKSPSSAIGLEAVLVIIPTILVIYLATHGFAIFMEQRKVPENHYEITVEAFMWGWNIIYPNGKTLTLVYPFDEDLKKLDESRLSEATFYIPMGKYVKFKLTSLDVIHAFYIHPTRVVEDAVPGRYTYLVVKINKPGDYWVFCREYCGSGHAMMNAIAKVVSEEEFNQWLSK